MKGKALPIEAVQIGQRHRHDLGDVRALARSIEEVGLLQPIVVRPDGTLVAGRRRLEACRLLGHSQISVHVVDIDSIVKGEAAENGQRKDFTPSEAVAVYQAIIGEEGERAGERMAAGRSPSAKFAEGHAGRARDGAAAYVGMSGWSMQKAVAVVEAAEREPGAFGDLVQQMDRSGRVDGAHRELRRRQTWNGTTAVAPPVGEYRTIVVDPPWPYTVRADDPSHRGALPYPMLEVEEIASLRLPMAEECHVWLWTTNVFLPDAFRVLEAWGVTYRSCLTWAKDKMGLGDWLRGQTEHCLLATRGALRRKAGRASTLLVAPHTRCHSQKPAAFYELVEGQSPAPRLDMFARRRREGWEAWGNEVEGGVG